jgi:hypothetical protein
VGGHGGKGSPGKSPKKKRNAAQAQPSVAARLCDALQVGNEMMFFYFSVALSCPVVMFHFS